MTDLVERTARDSLDSAARTVTVDASWQSDLVRRVEDRIAAHRRRRAAVVACAAATALLAGIAVATSNGKAHPSPAPSPDQPTLVDVGAGRRLALECSGPTNTGRPTVVIEAAVTAQTSFYAPTVRALVPRARVCTYARAGTGASDAAERLPRTATDLAEDLGRLIDVAGLGPRVVLVADEGGAMSATMLAATDPHLIAGLVLLDPQGAHAAERQQAILGVPADGEPRVIKDLRRLFTSQMRSSNGEHLDLAESEAQVAGVLDTQGAAFGSTPVAVLIPGNRIDRVPDLPAKLRREWLTALLDDQHAYAAESTNGTSRTVPGTSGGLAVTAPDEVVAAVEQIMSAV